MSIPFRHVDPEFRVSYHKSYFVHTYIKFCASNYGAWLNVARAFRHVKPCGARRMASCRAYLAWPAGLLGAPCVDWRCGFSGPKGPPYIVTWLIELDLSWWAGRNMKIFIHHSLLFAPYSGPITYYPSLITQHLLPLFPHFVSTRVIFSHAWILKDIYPIIDKKVISSLILE